jgi:uncharacterized cupredoxin-like copper-binding protein
MFDTVRMTRRQLIVTALPATLLASVLAACGSGGSAGDSQGSASVPSGSAQATAAVATVAESGQSGPSVTAIANDFTFKFSTNSVPAGKVHFVLENQSKTYQHELWVYPQNQPKLQSMIAAKDASKQNGGDVSEEDYLQNVAGKVEDLDPGKTASFDATLQPGTYEMACFVTTSIGGKNMVHYEMGMHGLLTVQ